MSWIAHLNTGQRRVQLAGCTAEVLLWAHSPQLIDNVPHRHTYFEICMVGAHGSGVFTAEGAPHLIEPGDIFFARPGVVHQIQNTGRELMELYWVSFSLAPQAPEKASSAARSFAESKVLVARDDGTLGALWHALHLTANSSSGRKSLMAQLQVALLQAILLAGTPQPEHEAAGQVEDADCSAARVAMRYIHDNLDRRLPIAELASYVHLSPRHLTRLFQSHAGTSPATYIETARLDRACALLLDQSLPIKAIAQQVGYLDVHHFTRTFGRRLGTSPGKVRRSPNAQEILPRPPGFR
jgi:AraC family L-rhamnose operon transcriptional activator RhaR